MLSYCVGLHSRRKWQGPPDLLSVSGKKDKVDVFYQAKKRTKERAWSHFWRMERAPFLRHHQTVSLLIAAWLGNEFLPRPLNVFSPKLGNSASHICLLTAVVVSASAVQPPPSSSAVSAGPLMVNWSKSSRKSHTAEMGTNNYPDRVNHSLISNVPSTVVYSP